MNDCSRNRHQALLLKDIKNIIKIKDMEHGISKAL